jgi:ABC-type multidrug transport system permease subunit
MGFTRSREQHFTIVQAIPTAILFAYIASVGNRPFAQAYIYFGAFFLLAWANTIFRVGWMLSGELFSGTLDHTLVSRAPTSALILGRAAAITLLGLLCGVLAIVVVVLFTGRMPPGQDLPLLLVSLAVGGLAVLAISVMMSPLNLIVDARAGFFNGIIPLLFFFSGLIFPASRLPAALEWVPKVMPTSWAMEAIVGAGQGSPRADILMDLGAALALTALFFLLAKAGIDVVEHRVRVSGTLGRS